MSPVLPCLAAFALAGSPYAPVLRVNCGGGPVVVAGQLGFQADQPYAPGGFGYEGGTTVTVASANGAVFVGAWQSPWKPLHERAREGFAAYRFDVPNRDYLVRLHLSEIVLHGPGLRTFDLLVEGIPAVTDLDLSERFGIQYAAVLSAFVSVSDGRLDIEAAGADPALLSAIEVLGAPPQLPLPAALAGVTARGGYGRNIVSWDDPMDPAAAMVTVYRAADPAGPFAPVATVPVAPTRWFDDAVLPGQTWHYRVEPKNAALAAGPTSAPVAATTLASAKLPVFEILIDPENQKIIDEIIQSDPKEEVPATFVYDGRSWSVGVRYRGGGSRTYSKKSWEVKFPPEDTFFGQTSLNLKAHFIDGFHMREPLAIELFQWIGHPVSRQQLVHLRVNGEYRGVYDSIEQVEVEYLKARDRDPDITIYKCDSNLFLLPDPAQYELYYEKKTNKGSGHGDLIAFLELVNLTPEEEFENAIADVFDLDDYLGYLAAVAYLADVDSVRHNTYLLHDESLDRWELVTWDNDVTWGGFQNSPNENLPIDFGTETAGPPPYNALKSRVLAVPSLRWRYVEKLRALLKGPFGPEGIAEALSGMHVALQGDAPADPFDLGFESDEPFADGPMQMLAFATARKAILEAAMTGYQPATAPTKVWINELLADNDAGAVDEAGENEDWIELYNASPSAVDVSGHHLTDDIGEPAKFALPPGTVIPAYGRLLLFADGQPEQGPTHLPFKLSKAGEEIGLFAPDGETLLDFVHFRPLPPDVSYGRTADAGPFFAVLSTPTPGAPNEAGGNLPPWITWVEHDPPAPAAKESVTVRALIADSDGLFSAILRHRVGAGPFAATPMSLTDFDRYEATVAAAPSGSVVEYYVEATDSLGKSATAPGGAPDEVFSYTVVSPPPLGLRIGEVMADNVSTLADEAGGFDDWIEVTNTSLAAVDLSGMFLTDDGADPTKWAFPPGAVIAPQSSLIVWADGDPAEGPLHASFKLSKTGEEVWLVLNDGITPIDGFSFGPQMADASFGRLLETNDSLFVLLDPSPGLPNVPAPGGHTRFDAGNLPNSGVGLEGASPAVTGAAARYAMTGAPALSACHLLLGFSSLLQPAGAAGTLLLAPVWIVPFSADASGGADLILPIPDDASLPGVSFLVQVHAAGAGLSNAVASTISGQ